MRSHLSHVFLPDYPLGHKKLIATKVILRYKRTFATKSNSVFAIKDDQDEIIPEFCIIETRESALNLENLRHEDLEFNIQSRRNKIFLLMEEVRRLKIQQRIRLGESDWLSVDDFSVAKENF